MLRGSFILLALLGAVPMCAATVEELEAKAELRPQDADLQFNIGVLAYQQKQLAKAEAALRRAEAMKPKDAETLELLGKVLQEEGRWEASLDVLRRCLQTDPQRPEAMLSLGVGLGRAGRPEEAVVWLEKAAAHSPQDPEIQVDLGLLWMRQAKPDRALAAFERVRQLEPANAVALANLCQLYNQAGKPVLAQAACLAALAHPSDKPANAHYNLGFAQLKLGQPQAAEKEFKLALDSDPGLASAHYNLGLLRYQAGDLAEAAAQFQSALMGRAGDYPEARYNLAVVLGDRGDWLNAAGEYKELLAKDPGDKDAKDNLAYVTDKGIQELLGQGTAAYLQGHYQDATAAWKKALALDPRNADAQGFLARAQEKLAAGQGATAGAANNDAEVLTEAARAMSAGHLQAAVRLLGFYVRNHPGDADARRKLSLARAKLLAQAQDLLDQADAARTDGDSDGAAELAKRARVLDPGNTRAKAFLVAAGQAQAGQGAPSQAAYYEGVKLYLKGDMAKARDAWKAVLEADPGNLDAKRSLDHVEAELAALQKLRD